PFVVAEHGAELLQPPGAFVGAPDDFGVPRFGNRLPQAHHGLGGIVDIRTVDAPDRVVAPVGRDQYAGTIGLRRAGGFIAGLQRARPPFRAVATWKQLHTPVVRKPTIIVVV